jgi:lipoate-protein ligase A
LTWWDIDRPALVLGSAQPATHVDERAAAACGVEVLRRASGGGAVLLTPGDVVWGDLVIGPEHPRWSDDVVAAAAWVGDAWVEALVELGLAGAALQRHRGNLVRTRWSSVVCFAGLGPGEVLWNGRKVLGISQRRTRRGARFQMAAVLRWDPTALVRLLALAPEDRAAAAAALDVVATGLPVPALALERAVARALSRRS